MIKFKVTPVKALSDSFLEELATNYHEADRTNDVRYGKQTYLNMLKSYKHRQRSFLVTGTVDDELVSTTFVLNGEESNFIEENEPLRAKLSSIGELDEFCIPAHIFVKPEARGKGYGIKTEKKARAAAKAMGFKYILGFGGMNETIVGFYGHNYPMGPKKQWLNVTDWMGRNISLHTL